MEKRTCKQCGEAFELSEAEIKFYKDKKLSLPKRCKKCREKNKTTAKTYMQKKCGSRRGLFAVLLIVLIIIGVLSGKLMLFTLDRSSGTTVESDVQGIDSENDGTVSIHSGIESKNEVSCVFRNEQLRNEHFEKHGADFNYATAKEYEAGAGMVVNNTEALHKTEKEDGDDIYYIENTNEFIIVSTDGYLRTYFKPEDGIDYYNRQ